MATDFKTCKRCGRIYNYTGSVFCPGCSVEMDKCFRTVKDFLYKNPDKTLAEVAEQTGTEEWVILYFLREGRLEMQGAGDALRCESCGEPIATGRLCSKCANGISEALGGAVAHKTGGQSQQGTPECSTKRMHTTYIDINNRR